MPKCKNCGKKFEQIKFLQKFCLESECVKAWVEKVKDDAWKKKKKQLVNEIATLQELTKAAQLIFNKWIRLRDAGQNCISCNKPAKKENAGHYFNANNHWNVRFDERNVHLQCEHCNTFLSGNLINYRENLINKIGSEEFGNLEQAAKITRKFTKNEMLEISRIYREKVKNQKKS